MTAATFERVARQRQYRNYIAPVDEYEYGREMFFNGISRERCTNDEQRLGFDDAALTAKRVLRNEWLVADCAQIAA